MERKRISLEGESHVSYIENQLNERIIGQPAAIKAVVTGLEKARLRDDRRPAGSFMFIGPTGVGKTQTAEALADILAIDKLNPNLIKIDGGQFAQSHETAALLGAPPGYVGREQKPVLDPNILEMPGSVLLFDEIEKAHPKVHDLLLQMMEGGKVKLLNSGYELNLTNTIIILTSNVGSREMQDTMANKRIGFAQDEEPVDSARVESAAFEALKRQFRPEFINRLDNVVTFNPLDDEQMLQVLDTHVERSNFRYERLGNFALKLSPALKNHLVQTAPLRKEFGFRPVVRNYEQTVEAPLSGLVAKDRVGGTEVEADYEDNQVAFYEGQPFGGATVGEIIALHGGDFSDFSDYDEPECEDDEHDYDVPENITPIRKRKK